MDFFTALAASNRESAAGVAPKNTCFAYLPTSIDPVTMKPRGADLFATFHASKRTGPKLQPITEPTGTIRFGGVELISLDAIGDLRTSAKTLEARVWPPVLLFMISHFSLRENAIEGRMRKSLRDPFADLLSLTVSVDPEANARVRLVRAK